MVISSERALFLFGTADEKPFATWSATQGAVICAPFGTFLDAWRFIITNEDDESWLVKCDSTRLATEFGCVDATATDDVFVVRIFENVRRTHEITKIPKLDDVLSKNHPKTFSFTDQETLFQFVSNMSISLQGNCGWCVTDKTGRFRLGYGTPLASLAFE